MSTKRKKHGAAFKAKVALEAVQENEAIAVIARRHRVHANQIYKWKRQLLANLERAFEAESTGGESSEREAELLQKIGELTIERDFLSNGLGRFR
jgi:transposase-like protein